MRRGLFLIAACVLCACSDDRRSPAAASGAGHGGAPGTGAGEGGAPPAGLHRDDDRQIGPGLPPGTTLPGSRLDRPGELPRPPAGRLPDDLKPPTR